MTKDHRVSGVLSFFSSRRNWDSPNPSPAGECAPTPFGSGRGGGRGTLAGERGWESPDFDEGTYTLWYSVNICALSERPMRTKFFSFLTVVGKNSCGGVGGSNPHSHLLRQWGCMSSATWLTQSITKWWLLVLLVNA
jgi:hypothetical protein